jgi:hypothetical protein
MSVSRAGFVLEFLLPLAPELRGSYPKSVRATGSFPAILPWASPRRGRHVVAQGASPGNQAEIEGSPRSGRHESGSNGSGS